MPYGFRLKSATLVVSAFVLAAGLGVAWVDTRPNWDDTGVTVFAILLTAGTGGLAGVPPFLCALLAAAPLVLAELSTGAAVLVAVPIAVGAALAGAYLRRFAFPPRQPGRR
ncbi:MAG: hypothetical protein H6682_10710 [Candidatus Eisenbacteria bacterium]|nr:hypothetical protein [Candidatus Eisenbacteria bacterium]